MHSCGHYCVNYMFIVSWVAVPTLLAYYWISLKEIELLEIAHDADHKKVQRTFLYASLMYLVIALVFTIYVCCIRPA